MKSILSTTRRLGVHAPVALAAVLLAACAGEVTSQEPAAPSADDGDEQVLAVLDGEPITMEDLQDVVGNDLATLEFQYRSQRHQLVERGLEQVLREKLLAAEAESRGTTVEALVAAEVGEVEVSPAEVVAFYEANQARLQGQPLEQLRPAIRQFLTEQRQEEGLSELTDRLAEERSLERRLEPFRVDVETAGHPSWGPEDAAVTLLEFSDFECPYCGRFFDTLEQVKAEYGDRVRIVFRQFPLRQIHPNAQKAAEASLCAEDQGRFWEMHDVLFREQDSLTVSDLKEKAERLELDTGQFAECLDSDRHAEQVQVDLEAGLRVGVEGTPALFVNGQPLEGGAIPFEVLSEALEEELERLGR